MAKKSQPRRDPCNHDRSSLIAKLMVAGGHAVPSETESGPSKKSKSGRLGWRDRMKFHLMNYKKAVRIEPGTLSQKKWAAAMASNECGSGDLILFVNAKSSSIPFVPDGAVCVDFSSASIWQMARSGRIFFV